jgi:hypothetical protein
MKRLTSLVIVAASLVLATGTATAFGATRPDDRANHGAGAVGLVVSNQVVRPDDRATHGPAAIAAYHNRAVRPDDRAWRGAGPAPAIVPDATSTGVDGFDWADASIGAAGALGLGLLLIGGTAFVLRQRRVGAYS